jgi:hypothetical protein
MQTLLVHGPASRGAATIVHAATAADGNGAYFDEQRLSRPHPDALDQEVQERLHRVTQGLLTPSR